MTGADEYFERVKQIVLNQGGSWDGSDLKLSFEAETPS